ncbi:limbic system-associated membrane protein [Drosophila pseudoobscura]|uniref:Limbic system-associated membrane protein n=1 Tax=Drosophila pseudoobscura pseudoobscura TaxID=46245 RepID=A0A6I8UKQ6_DROPS|nr:limbic system-associated membrane protein [Drosophila pseudoobscura]
MRLIGFMLNLAALTAVVLGNHHESLSLSPAEHSVVRYTNESLIVQCRSPDPDVKLHWKSPKGEIIREHKGRIHIEQTSPEQLKIVFAHIALADKGNWSCEAAEGRLHSKSFDLIVYQKITFTENVSVITVKEGDKDKTILCEVKGEPQPNITWHFNGQPISVDTADGSKYRILADGLLINKVTQSDTGEYTCRAYQVNSIASDMQERTVLMKIEHKPFWTHKQFVSMQYAYINGTASIMCEAQAEPPATFTWHRKQKRLHSNERLYTIEGDHYWSRLTVHVLNASVFDNYRCRATNHLGSIERTKRLEQGEKPPSPITFQLRGFNSNTFDVDVSAPRGPEDRGPMEVNGFRIEYMSELEFKSDAGKWTNARRKDFPFEEGATFLITNLEPDTYYLMRAASRNLAGFSDFTKVEKYKTLSLEPRVSSAHPLPQSTSLCFGLMALMCLTLRLGY